MENENKNEYSLIFTIVNKGSTDLVMEAARKAGGTGGTITGARGTGNPELAKFYGFTIQPDKEIVFIVVKNEIADKVVKQIYDDAGISTRGQGITFTIPITDVVGLTPFKKEEEKTEE
jgi:nitrogen regulatory protein PII